MTTSSRRPARTRTSVYDSSPFPTRAILALIGTALSVALLLSFRTPDVVPSVAGGLGSGQPVAQPTRSGDPFGGVAAAPTSPPNATASTRPGSLGTTGDQTDPTNVARPTPPARGRSTAAPATAAPVETAAPAAKTADVTGPVERTPYGDVQVEVKTAAGRITDVIAVQLPSDRRRSAEISQYVEPILHDEALQAQSAQIDLISGATWTSGAYQASLQGALQQLGG